MALNQQQQKKIVTFVVIGVLGLGLMAWYWWMFGADRLKGAEARYTEKEKKLKDVNSELKTIAEFEGATKDKREELKKQIKEVSSMLPRTRKPEGFLDALVNILRTTGVLTTKVGPEKVQEYERHAEIPYAIDATGLFDQIGRFLSFVEQNPKRFMRVKTLKISNDLERPLQHPVEVHVATFMLKE
jgi:Tfp pilus assembly protein PilO